MAQCDAQSSTSLPLILRYSFAALSVAIVPALTRRFNPFSRMTFGR